MAVNGPTRSTLTTSKLAVAMYSITASYDGATDNPAWSSNPVTVNVSPDATTTTENCADV
jgi:hypothetical protein